LAVTISVGVAAATACGDNRDRLLKRADDALYNAKSAGRNRVIVRPVDT
jgi:two-component system, cell cycle response regulator